MDKSSRRFFNRNHFFNKSILSQMLLILLFASISFLILCYLIVSALQNILQKNAMEYNKITFNKIRTELIYDYNSMNSLYEQIQNQSEIKSLLMLSYNQKSKFINSSREYLTQYRILNTKIMDISLVSSDVHYSSIYSNKKLNYLWEQLKDNKNPWFSIDSSDFTNMIAETTMQNLFLYGGNIYFNGENIGAIIISLSKDPLMGLLTSSPGTQAYYFLCNEKTLLYSLNCEDQLSSDIYSAFQSLNLNNEEINNTNDRMISINNHTYLLQYNYIPQMNCYLLSALDIQQTITDTANISPLVSGCLLLIIFFIITIFLIVNHTLVLPLRKFNKMLQIIQENPKGNIPHSIQLHGCTEIVSIGNEFSVMMKNINDLNKKIFVTSSTLYETKLQKQEAEISYLRSQIDPHFLYNTLEVVRKMALDKNAPELAEIALNMGKIFRYNTKGSTMVPLKDEIGIVKSYIHIQQSRFQGKIDVLYNIAEDTMEIPIMKMLLQPIIENAIFHGLELKDGSGTLMISCKIRDNTLIITVRDDGIGISAQKLDTIKAELQSNIYDTSKHVGIINTYARIRLQYGPPFGLDIESNPSDGTIISITLPANAAFNRKEIL